jgi:uncharacterized protein YndB with AHSA1/START domain
MNSDSIKKNIVLRVPRARVWRAIASTEEFGTWFGMKLAGTFTPGARISGRITAPGYEHLTLELAVERVDPEQLISYRWHPYAMEPGVDYSAEPTTLVEFHLAEIPGGTELTVVESGFDNIPLERRAEAYRMNDEGWTEQITNIERYVTA